MTCLILWAVAPVVVTIVLMNSGPEKRDFWIGAAFPTAVGFAAVVCVFVIAATDDGPWFLNDDDFTVGLQVVAVLLAGSGLLIGTLAALLGRRLRSLQET